jgi:chromosome partitioning protein
MRTLAVVNMKGGVGKTTTAVHLAAGFAQRGARVLLVDGDPQGTVAHTLRIGHERSLVDLLRGAPAASVVVDGVRPNLDVIVSTPAAFALESELAGAMQRETLLDRALRPLSSYDIRVLDTSPAMSLLTYNALLAAGELVLPVGMELMALIGARQTLDGVDAIRHLWPERDLRIASVLPTGVNPTTHATRATLSALAADPRLAPFVFARGIRQCLDLTYATAEGQTIWEYAPRSRAAEDFTALLDLLQGDAPRDNRTDADTTKTGSAAQAEKTEAVL